MQISKRFFSKSEMGDVYAFDLRNDEVEITILTLGCIIQKIIYRGKDIVCGFDDADAYLHSGTYYGAMVGRCCNRMQSLHIGEREYKVTLNENGNTHLHGGKYGFDKKIWNAKPDETGITFSCFSADGEEGYPGNLETTVRYELDGASLSIICEAKADADTAVNLTNHSYFNLDGIGGTVLDQTLYIPAWYISECDEYHIPTGKHLPCWGGPLDFNTPKPIGRDIHADNPNLTPWKGYDNNFILRKADGTLTMAARAEGKDIAMEVLTDLPCVQLYTGNYTEDALMKYGLEQIQYRAFCVETQLEPNSFNFEKTWLKAGETYHSRTIFRWEPIER